MARKRRVFVACDKCGARVDRAAAIPCAVMHAGGRPEHIHLCLACHTEVAAWLEAQRQRTFLAQWQGRANNHYDA